MDVGGFSRELRGGRDRSEFSNNLEDGEPLNLGHMEDIVDGANTELTDPNRSAAVFAKAVAAEVENTAPFDFVERWLFCPEDNAVEGANTELTEPLPSAAGPAAVQAQSPIFSDFGYTIANEEKTMDDLHRGFELNADIGVYFSYFDQQPGVEHTADDSNQADIDLEEATATHEHGSNNLADSRVSGIHRGDLRAGDTETVVSSQPLSTQSYNRGKNELDRFRNQEHSLINHKLSRGASCSTLPEAIGDEDEAQSTSADIDGEDLVSDPGVPKVGLEFCSEEAVYNFYNKYAKQTGFRVRKGKPQRSRLNKDTITGKYFLCSCQGHKSKKQIEKPTLYKRRDTRTGCEANIKCVVSDGTWKISKVVLEHNHSLEGCLAITHGRAEDSRGTMAYSTDNIVDGVSTVGEQALVSDVDGSDVSRGTWKNHPMLEHKDTQDLIDHFKNRQIEDPSFFYTAQVKAASGMANFFWRDSRSKIDYEHFGDVLVLDTRTEIKKYVMICAVFWGLNNHRQRIIFGCAFLVDQTMGSLNWLLRSFVEAMSCHKPKTIITEVSEEIADAVRVVLPETSHCLPFWSILHGFSKNLSALSDRASVGNLFKECVFHVHSREEFELKWNSFVGKYKLHENRWFASLSGMREKWSHAFTKNVFSAGLLSIQNNEDARAIFGNLSCETMTLSQYAQRCEKMAKDMRRKEFLEDMRCEKISANLQSNIPVEKEAERLYTKPIFHMFRKELSNILSLSIEEIGGKAAHREFKLTEQGSMKIDTVKFDPSNSTLVCSCAKFESVGILCFHALKVLNFMNIFNIPSRYLLKRWTKTAKDSLPVDTPSTGTARDRDQDDLFKIEFMRQANHVVHMSVNNTRKRKAMAIIKSAVEDIARVPKTEEVTVALDNSDGNDDMDQTTWNCALRSQLEQDKVAKSGMRCSRVKRKVRRP